MATRPLRPSARVEAPAWTGPLGTAEEPGPTGVVVQLCVGTATPDELAAYLFRELSFPAGAFLMTGTGIVPPDDFTLQLGDTVSITVESVGTLTNPVA